MTIAAPPAPSKKVATPTDDGTTTSPSSASSGSTAAASGSIPSATKPTTARATGPFGALHLPDVRVIPIAQLHESPLNSRQRFDTHKLQELADSMLASGQLTPLLVRPSKIAKLPGFEIAAGHRRRRAAAIAKLDALQVIVRDLSDQEFLEILTIENLQREDLHPLDEARGYAELMKSAGYDVAKIADRIGKSGTYVRDRLHLLQLTKPAQALFLDGTITAAHAVLLSRLSAADQKRVIGDKDTSALFTPENVLGRPEEELELEDARKPISVRELQSWIDKHVRFDEAQANVPTFFPETAAVVRQATEQEEKIVKITHEHFVVPEARTDEERTYGPASWKRADGTHGSKTCEYAITGVVAIGPGRGEAFKVCVDKKKCKVHWATEQRRSAERAKSSTRAAAGNVEDERSQVKKRQEEQAREEAKRTAWSKAKADILTAIAARVKKLPVGGKGELAGLILHELKGWDGNALRGIADYMPVGSSAEDLVRHAAFMVLMKEVSEYSAYQEFPKRAKALGIDLAKILTPDAPKKDASPAKAKKGRKAKARG